MGPVGKLGPHSQSSSFEINQCGAVHLAFRYHNGYELVASGQSVSNLMFCARSTNMVISGQRAAVHSYSVCILSLCHCTSFSDPYLQVMRSACRPWQSPPNGSSRTPWGASTLSCSTSSVDVSISMCFSTFWGTTSDSALSWQLLVRTKLGFSTSWLYGVMSCRPSCWPALVWTDCSSTVRRFSKRVRNWVNAWTCTRMFFDVVDNSRQ